VIRELLAVKKQCDVRDKLSKDLHYST